MLSIMLTWVIVLDLDKFISIGYWRAWLIRRDLPFLYYLMYISLELKGLCAKFINYWMNLTISATWVNCPCRSSQDLIIHSRLCFTISQRLFLFVTLVETPMPHVSEQAPHSVVCSMQFSLGSHLPKPTVSSWRKAEWAKKKIEG